MTANPNLNPGSDGAPLPSDLAPIADAAELLARAERAAPASTFEDRLFMATRAAIAQGTPADVADIAVLLDDLAAADRSMASVSLEDRLAMASFAHLRAPAAPARSPVHVVWRSRLRLAVAAAIAVATGGGVWLSIRPAADDRGGGIALLNNELLTLASSLNDSSPLAAFDDLHRDLDALDQSVRGSWFPADTSSDEESL